MTRRLFLVLTTLCLPLAAGADADDQFDGRWYATGMVSYIDDGPNRNVDDGLAGVHIGGGHGFRGATAIEISAFGLEMNADGFNADQRQWGLEADVLWRLGRSEYFAPFLLLGAGYQKTQFDDPRALDDDGLIGSLGIGVLVPLRFAGLQLRTELRARADSEASGRGDYFLILGLQKPLSKKILSSKDSDADSVGDINDMCPDTPPNSEVDRFGCARD